MLSTYGPVPGRGQAHCCIAAGGTSSSVAVNEPLELCLRAQLGRRGRNQVRIAVIELLELCLRALLGRRGRNQVRML